MSEIDIHKTPQTNHTLFDIGQLEEISHGRRLSGITSAISIIKTLFEKGKGKDGKDDYAR